MHADDGSRYYNDSYNFVVYGGSGSSWGNHKLNIGNWFVYPQHQSDLDALDRDMLSKDAHLPIPLKLRPSGTTQLEVYPGLCVRPAFIFNSNTHFYDSYLTSFSITAGLRAIWSTPTYNSSRGLGNAGRRTPASR